MAETLQEFVESIRRDKNLTAEIPSFEPNNGNESARFLFVLEAPGPKAIQTGYVSQYNPDETAGNLRVQLQEADIPDCDVAIWNLIPWYLGNRERTKIRMAKAIETEEGIHYLIKLLSRLPNLRCIVLVGTAARKAHIALSSATPKRILSCHHTSPKVMNIYPERYQRNVAIFRFMRETCCDT